MNEPEAHHPGLDTTDEVKAELGQLAGDNYLERSATTIVSG